MDFSMDFFIDFLADSLFDYAVFDGLPRGRVYKRCLIFQCISLWGPDQFPNGFSYDFLLVFLMDILVHFLMDFLMTSSRTF